MANFPLSKVEGTGGSQVTEVQLPVSADLATALTVGTPMAYDAEADKAFPSRWLDDHTFTDSGLVSANSNNALISLNVLLGDEGRYQVIVSDKNESNGRLYYLVRDRVTGEQSALQNITFSGMQATTYSLLGNTAKVDPTNSNRAAFVAGGGVGYMYVFLIELDPLDPLGNTTINGATSGTVSTNLHRIVKTTYVKTEASSFTWAPDGSDIVIMSPSTTSKSRMYTFDVGTYTITSRDELSLLSHNIQLGSYSLHALPSGNLLARTGTSYRLITRTGNSFVITGTGATVPNAISAGRMEVVQGLTANSVDIFAFTTNNVYVTSYTIDEGTGVFTLGTTTIQGAISSSFAFPDSSAFLYTPSDNSTVYAQAAGVNTRNGFVVFTRDSGGIFRASILSSEGHQGSNSGEQVFVGNTISFDGRWLGNSTTSGTNRASVYIAGTVHASTAKAMATLEPQNTVAHLGFLKEKDVTPSLENVIVGIDISKGSLIELDTTGLPENPPEGVKVASDLLYVPARKNKVPYAHFYQTTTLSAVDSIIATLVGPNSYIFETPTVAVFDAASNVDLTWIGETSANGYLSFSIDGVVQVNNSGTVLGAVDFLGHLEGNYGTMVALDATTSIKTQIILKENT